jgi:glycosyltransferase involved in cell wall biosynthesis
MKIAIDLTQIPVEKTGAGIYALNLVKEIMRMDLSASDLYFYFFVQDDDEELQRLVTGNPACRLTTINSRRFRKLPLRFLFEQLLLPRRCKQLGVDMIYSFHYTIPIFTRLKRGVIFHDMTFYLFPHLHQFIRRAYFKCLIPIALKKSLRVVTVSQSTKTDIIERFKKINPEKIAVIPLGVEPVQPLTSKKEKEEEHLKNLGLNPRQYLLFLGTLEPRKNIAGLIDAYHHLTTQNPGAVKELKLVIAGGKGWFYQSIFQKVKQYHLEESVIFTGYVSDEMKQTLLRHAYLFVYPSFYEGFGLPILEAMAHGIPVITGNISSLPEVAGDAAILVDPHRWQDIARAMAQLLDDKVLYDELSKKGPERVQSFSWQNNARKTLELLASLETH